MAKGAKKSLLSIVQKKKSVFPNNMFQQSASGSFFS